MRKSRAITETAVLAALPITQPPATREARRAKEADRRLGVYIMGEFPCA